MTTTGIILSMENDQHREIAQHPNPLSFDDEAFHGELISRSLCVPEKQWVRLVLEFTEEFNIYSAPGAKVVIACGLEQQAPGSTAEIQSFFIKKEDLKQGKHVFDCLLEWDVETGRFEMEDAIKVPGPVDLTEASQAGTEFRDGVIANKGCLAVFVVRGKMRERVTLNNYERVAGATDPPETDRNRYCGKARCIRYEDFIPLKSLNGQAIVFELRNMTDAGLGTLREMLGEDNWASNHFLDDESLTATDTNDSDDTRSYSADSDVAADYDLDDGSGTYQPGRDTDAAWENARYATRRSRRQPTNCRQMTARGRKQANPPPDSTLLSWLAGEASCVECGDQDDDESDLAAPGLKQESPPAASEEASGIAAPADQQEAEVRHMKPPPEMLGQAFGSAMVHDQQSSAMKQEMRATTPPPSDLAQARETAASAGSGDAVIKPESAPAAPEQAMVNATSTGQQNTRMKQEPMAPSPSAEHYGQASEHAVSASRATLPATPQQVAAILGFPGMSTAERANEHTPTPRDPGNTITKTTKSQGRKGTPIDLTQDEDTTVAPQQQIAEAGPSHERATKRREADTADEDEDEQSLEYLLEEVQIKKKLWMVKKRKMAAAEHGL